MKDKTAGDTSFKNTGYGILPRRKVIPLEIKGAERGMLFLNKAAEKGSPVTSDLVCSVHKLSFQDILQKDAGRFRTVQVEYSGKEAPHYTRVSELMKLLTDDIEFAYGNLPGKTKDVYIDRVVEMISLFQHRFLVIHPFIDYNGRLARMFTNYLLMRLNLPIIEIAVTNVSDRKAYISALHKADGGNYDVLFSLISAALNRSILAIQKKVW